MIISKGLDGLGTGGGNRYVLLPPTEEFGAKGMYLVLGVTGPPTEEWGMKGLYLVFGGYWT